MDKQEKMNFIAIKLGKEELLAAAAEEATELAQAALKLRRAYSGTNPTPKGIGQAFLDLVEEIADVQSCIDVIKNSFNEKEMILFESELINVQEYKLDRWVQRLELNEK